MADCEKVIKGLKCCIYGYGCDSCESCPYYGKYAGHCVSKGLMPDVLELLKKQQEQKFFVDFDGKITPLPIQPQWISVKDRLPNEKQSKITHDFEYVLCATTFGEVRAYKFGTPIGWSEPHFWHGAGKMDEYVTHWMPLPEPPEVKQDE